MRAGEDFYRSGQQQMVIFSKGQVGDVTSSGNGATVNFRDLILDEDVALQADLVVLDLGMVPNSGPDPYAANESQEGMSDEEKRRTTVRAKPRSRSTRSSTSTTARALTCRS